MNIVIVPAISALVFGIIKGYKYIVEGKEKYIKLIPIIAGALGGIIGLITYYVDPSIISASNFLTAIVIGSASGLSSTGIHQIYKQLVTKNKEDK